MRNFKAPALLITIFFITVYSCNDHTTDVIAETTGPSKLKEDLGIFKGLLEDVHAGSFAFNSKQSLNSLFDSISATITEPLTEREFLDKIDFIIENIHCAHTGCYFDEKYFDTLTRRKYFFPIPLIKIGDKIFVNTEAYNIPYGSEIFLINNHPVKEIFKKLLFHKHTDGLRTDNKDAAINDDFAYDYFLAFGPEKSFDFRYRDAKTNEVETKTIHAESLNHINDLQEDVSYIFSTDVPYDFTINDEKKAGILTIRSFNEGTYSEQTAFSNFLENSFALLKLKGIKNLVIDYRNNGGGYFICSYKLLSYFISSPVMQFDSIVRRFNQLPYEEYVSANDSSTRMSIDSSYGGYLSTANHNYSRKLKEIDTCFPADDHFNGKLFILTNGNVVSAAASSASLLKEIVHATIIGEETGGGYSAFNSEILSYTLPNSGIRVDIPTLRYYPPVTKKENINTVKPDYYIPVSKENFDDMDDGPMQFVLDSLLSK